MHNFSGSLNLANAARRLLYGQLEELILMSVQLLRDTDSLYQHISDQSLHDQMRKTISLTLMRIINEPIPASLSSAAFETGQLRATQQVDLHAVLHSFRIDLRVLWEAFLIDAQSHGLSDNAAYLSDLVRVWEAVEANIQDVSEGYQLISNSRDQQTIDMRTTVFHRLLGGDDYGSGTLSSLLLTLGFEPSGPMHCVVVELTESEFAALAACQARLNQRYIKNYFDWRGQYLVGLVQSPTISESFLAELLTEFREYKTGIAYARTSNDIRNAVNNTRTLVAALRHSGIYTLRQNWLTALSFSEPLMADAIAGDVFFRFDRLTPYTRTGLLETIQAFFDTDGTVNAISKRTFRHRNTVRSRLNQIEVLTGLRLNCPRDIGVLAVAFSALGMNRHHLD